MKPKKIVIIYAGAAYWGGVETYIEQLFLNADKRLIELEILSLGDWPLASKLRDAGFGVEVVDFKWYRLDKAFTISGLSRKNGYCLLASQGMVANFYGRMASLLSGIPSLVTVHSDYKFDYPGLKKYLYLLSFLPLAFVTKRYITVSNFLKRETKKLWVSDKKIKVIYNGVKDIGLQPHQKGKTAIFGSLGRLHYKKGYSGLIKAAALLPDLDFEIRIWGDGEEKESLTSEIKQLGLEKRVKLMGFTKDIVAALAGIDYYIQPSLEEGFGITVAEAMYAGKPLIVTPAGSLPELIENGKTGYICKDFTPEEIGKSIRALVSDPSAEQMAQNARSAAVKRFGISMWVSEIEKVYLETAK